MPSVLWLYTLSYNLSTFIHLHPESHVCPRNMHSGKCVPCWVSITPLEYELNVTNSWYNSIYGNLHHFIFTHNIDSRTTDVAWVNWHFKHILRDTISLKGYFANFPSIIYPDFHNHQGPGYLFSISLIFHKCYHRLVVRYGCYSNYKTHFLQRTYITFCDIKYLDLVTPIPGLKIWKCVMK